MEQHLGRHHPLRATLLTGLGASLVSLGELDEARATFEESIEIARDALGDVQAEVVTNYHNLGVVHSKAGNPEAALKTYLKALELKRKLYPQGNLSVASTANNVAGVLLRLDRHEEGLKYADEALALFDRKLGADAPASVPSLETKLRALRALGRPIDLDRITRVLAKLVSADVDPTVRADFEFTAAQIIDERANDRARARALGASALRHRKESQADADDSEIEAWLERHPPAPTEVAG